MEKRCKECGNLVSRQRFDDPKARVTKIFEDVHEVIKNKSSGLYSLSNLTEVANAAGVARGTVARHFEDIEAFRTKLIEWAIDGQLLDIITQALVMQHPVALAASESLKKKAIRDITK